MTKDEILQYFCDKIMPSVVTSSQSDDQLDLFVIKVVQAIEEGKLPQVCANKENC